MAHEHAPASYDRAFAVGVALNAGFVAVEAVAGVLVGSLALLADAGHNLSDVLALLLAWGAIVLGRRVPTARRTYGWRRTSILAALANALALVAVVGAVGWEAIHRLVEPSPVAGGPMIVVAALGVLVNSVAAWLFVGHRRHEEPVDVAEHTGRTHATNQQDAHGHHQPAQGDVNIRGAFLHLAADAGVSAGVVVAGAAMLLTGWAWLDPALSLVIGAVILASTWGLLRDALNLALDAVPAAVDERAVRAYLEQLPGVCDVHDLHIWALSTTHTALTAHLVLAELPRGDSLLAQTGAELYRRFGIDHPTLQLECGDLEHPCALAPAHLV